jgi:hypothetical protein
MAGYHLREIPRGEFGSYSKVEEEFYEFIDALEQDCHLMALQELSDFLLASYQYFLLVWKTDITNVVKSIGDRNNSDIEGLSYYLNSDNKNLMEAFSWHFEYGSLEQIFYCIDSYCRRFNMTLNDLWKMSMITKRVFDEGYRVAK